MESPFYILRTEKGFGGPNRHHEAHQIPLKNPKTDDEELKQLEEWLKSYHPEELFKSFIVEEKPEDSNIFNNASPDWVNRLMEALK